MLEVPLCYEHHPLLLRQKARERALHVDILHMPVVRLALGCTVEKGHVGGEMDGIVSLFP